MVVGTNCLEDGGKRYAIDKYVIHPEFRQNLYDNNIAVVKVEGDIDFNDQVQPVSYSCQGFPKNAGAVLSGWYRDDVSDSLSAFQLSKFKKKNKEIFFVDFQKFSAKLMSENVYKHQNRQH